MNVNCENNNYDNKLNTYNYLIEKYIDTIIKLIDTAYMLKILPFKIIMSMNYIKKYVKDNKFEILENGITYLLNNKEIILNFDIDNLDNLDEDSDDNMSIKSCVNNFNTNTSATSTASTSEILDLIIEIKNKCKKLQYEDIEIIQKYFEILIIILEKIQNIFN